MRQCLLSIYKNKTKKENRLELITLYMHLKFTEVPEVSAVRVL
jgi:hypothetical protein